MNFTQQQLDAISTHDRNVSVTAGAGSGKTRVLVERFIALLEANPAWSISSVVAITFTEKAAREMRARIRDAVTARADSENRAFWLRHLAALDSARISTIHSLCTMLLRANAAQAVLDPGFSVLDEAESTLLQADAIEETLTALVTDDSVKEILPLFLSYSPNEVRETLIKHLNTDVSAVSHEKMSVYAAWEQHFRDHAKQTLAALRADEQFVPALNWSPPFMPDRDDGLAKVWYVLQENREAVLNFGPMLAIAALRKIVPTKYASNWGREKVWGDYKNEAHLHIGYAIERCKETLKILGNLDDNLDPKAAELTVLWAKAIRLAQSVYTAKKRDTNTLDFADLERLTADLLRDPSVQARYQGVEFNHVMVDEFQDTNRAQQQIVYALTGLETAGSMFVVGDPKQSIYRFRGAENEVFDTVRQDIESMGGVRLSLSRSFRTHAQLVSAVNNFFDTALPGYETMQAERPSEPHHVAPVEITAIQTERLKTDNDSKQKFGVEEGRLWEAAELATRLGAIVTTEKRLIWDKAAQLYRPATFGDCAVLFRTYAAMEPVETAFKRAGVPFVTFAGRGYFKQQEVTDLVSLLRALYNPADNLALAAALRSPLFNFSDDALFGLRYAQVAFPLLWDAVISAPLDDFDVPDVQAIAFARSTLPHLKALAGRLTVAELLGVAVDQTAFLAALLSLPNGERKANNVIKLIDVARESGRVSLGDFTRFVNALKENEAREGEAPAETEGAVQLMTIYAAKGLEFPIVAIFDANADSKHADSNVLRVDPVLGLCPKIPKEAGIEDSDKQVFDQPFIFKLIGQQHDKAEEAESIRLLYVGMTRAEDYLLISGNYTSEAPGKKTWFGKLTEHFSLAVDPVQPIISTAYIRYHVPAQPPAALDSQSGGYTGWDQVADNRVAPIEPSGITLIRVPPIQAARTLAASDLILLVQDPAQFRRHLLYGAPTTIRGMGEEQAAQPVSARRLGEIVHEVLQWAHTGRDLIQKIRAAAWDHGVTDPRILEQILPQIAEMTARTQASRIWAEIRTAREAFREYPFLYPLGQHKIAGQVDVLFRNRYGAWTILDFKTDNVRPDHERAHARRYHMQLGVYAAALEAATGVAPRVALHYVRTAQTVEIRESVWREAVTRIENALAEAFSDEVEHPETVR